MRNKHRLMTRKEIRAMKARLSGYNKRGQVHGLDESLSIKDAGRIWNRSSDSKRVALVAKMWGEKAGQNVKGKSWNELGNSKALIRTDILTHSY